MNCAVSPHFIKKLPKPPITYIYCTEVLLDKANSIFGTTRQAVSQSRNVINVTKHFAWYTVKASFIFFMKPNNWNQVIPYCGEKIPFKIINNVLRRRHSITLDNWCYCASGQKYLINLLQNLFEPLGRAGEDSPVALLNNGPLHQIGVLYH